MKKLPNLNVKPLKSIVTSRPKYSFTLVLIFVWCLVACTPWLMSKYLNFGWAEAWSVFGVPAMVPTFADLRGLTHTTDCQELQSSLYVANPCSPFGLRYNYPLILLNLKYLGVNSDSTEILGGSLIFLFIITGSVLLKPQNIFEFIVSSVLIASTPIMLAIERANYDLLIFALLVLAILIIRRYSFFSYLIMGVLAVLKLFPAVTFISLTSQSYKNIILITLFILLPLGYYFYTIQDELLMIIKATPSSSELSYGMDLVIQGVLRRPLWWLATLILTSIVSIYMALEGIKSDQKYKNISYESYHLGALIYVSTWILQVSFCYRLIFVLLLLPKVFLDTVNNTASATYLLVVLILFLLSYSVMDVQHLGITDILSLNVALILIIQLINLQVESIKKFISLDLRG